jgi:hypothetical protein
MAVSAQSESSDNLVALPKQGITDDLSNEIGDEQFIEDLGKLKDLRSFLIEQAVPLKPGEDAALSFGKLNLLRWRSGGRSPTEDEWDALEKLTQDLFRHLSDPLRRRFLYRRLPWWVPQMVGGLGCAAFASLIVCIFLWGKPYQFIVPFYLFWLASLGAIGSISFIGMNALSVQDDATFDLSSTKLLTLRILLGALFGVVLTLPFGLGSFSLFLESLMDNKPQAKLTLNTLILLLPFVLGFSTSLVILILNQCVESVQTLFGRKSAPATPSVPPSSGSPAAESRDSPEPNKS